MYRERTVRVEILRTLKIIRLPQAKWTEDSEAVAWEFETARGREGV